MEGIQHFEKRLKPILSLWKKLNEVLWRQYISSPTNLHILYIRTYLHIFFIMQGISLIHDADDITDNIGNITDPWQSFILAEITVAKKLFKTIHRTLVKMHMAAKDISSIGRDDLILLTVLCENQVPFKWRQVWTGPKVLIDYLKAVVSRGIEAERRFKNDIHLSFCNQFDLAKVYNAESFLAALKLKNARWIYLYIIYILLSCNNN